MYLETPFWLTHEWSIGFNIQKARTCPSSSTGLAILVLHSSDIHVHISCFTKATWICTQAVENAYMLTV